MGPRLSEERRSIVADRGLARRTQGGAVLPAMAGRENSFAHRLRDAPEAKARLAEAAFALLRADETLFLAAGRRSRPCGRSLVLTDDDAAGPLAELGVEVRVTGG